MKGQEAIEVMEQRLQLLKNKIKVFPKYHYRIEYRQIIIEAKALGVVLELAKLNQELTVPIPERAQSSFNRSNDYSKWTVFALENRYYHLKSIINNKSMVEVKVTYPAHPYTRGKEAERVVIPINSTNLKNVALDELRRELEEVLKHWNEKAKEEQEKCLKN